jgi:serine/threonine protein kinase
MSKKSNWTTVAESRYPWERDALGFIGERFPAHEPYLAWANFEFIADDGSINEVDLLVFTPQGFFLIEIKSRPGRLAGDAGTWTWETDGKLCTVDSPLIAANLKAKKLASLLGRQRACKGKHRLPFLEPLVFCSAPGLQFELHGNAAYRVCLRDREDGSASAPGIMAAIMRRECPGLDAYPKGTHDRPTAKMVSQAIEQAGIRPSQRHRKVHDCVLDRLIAEGPGYQDWEATHTSLKAKRRVRLYLVHQEATDEDRRAIERAASREAQLLEMLQHPGILRCMDYTEHELGPALIFEHDPALVRLDHYLTQHQGDMNLDERLALIRQIAEVIRFAHDKRVVHRGLSPASILISRSEDGDLRVKVFNWQVGYRMGSTTSPTSMHVTATSHVDRLVEDASTAYMAPEALADGDNTGEHLDVFSLGAIAYHIFAGRPPAANGVELSNMLRTTKGLQISSALNGAGQWLQDLIQYSTHPEVPSRIDSVGDFLEYLDNVEEELTTPDVEIVENPARAQKGDQLPGGYVVSRRLGEGACSVALLVERGDQQFVLKVANDPENNARLRDEAEVLQKLRHQHVVEFVNTLEMGDRLGFLTKPVIANKKTNKIETVRDRLRKEGRFAADLLPRFGEDLLSVVAYLEEQGIPHRDIKPDNIVVGAVGRGDKLHLVLFDFSLSRMPADNIRAGTKGYLDPLLPLRKPPRWDLHAEHYAAAATLYELAAGQGNLPVWGDGTTDASYLDCEATIDPELFDPNLREELARFFQKAFRRNPGERFDNAEEMLRAWRQAFENLEARDTITDEEADEQLKDRLEQATCETTVAELGLGTRATNALDRANIITVAGLLATPLRRLYRLRGVGNKTRREISEVVKTLRKRLGRPEQPVTSVPVTVEEETPAAEGDVAALSVDLLAPLATRPGSRAKGEKAQEILQVLLGLDPSLDSTWPSQTDVARHLDTTPTAVNQMLKMAQSSWRREPAITKLREDLVEITRSNGGVCAVEELREAVLIARGCVRDEPERSRLAMAVIRAAVEVERTMAEPRLIVRRDRQRVCIALDQARADYACHLGREADKLASEDPLASPARAIERLRGIQPSELSQGLNDSRLVRLAVAASQIAALSSRQELYPRGMDALRAIKLSQGALLGVPLLTVQQVHERVLSRYPEAELLPDRPQLDQLLIEAGLDLKWNPDARSGQGCYTSSLREAITITTSSGPLSRLVTLNEPVQPALITPEIADARQFEERLHRADREGSFLALMVNPKHYQQAIDEIRRRFHIKLVDLEGIFLDALREQAEKARVNWDIVVQTDAKRNQGDWDKLLMLVGRAMPQIEAQLASPDRTMLIIYPGLLARYDQMDLLERLRERVGRSDGIHGVWLLIANDSQAMMDGRAVPIISPGQRARIPEAWLENRHRANGYKVGST